MPTTALAGDRSRRARNPRDITGTRYTDQLAAKAARDAAKNVDLDELRRQTRAEGFDAGHETGYAAFGRALHAMYQAEGIEAVQELLDELDAAEAGSA